MRVSVPMVPKLREWLAEQGPFPHTCYILTLSCWTPLAETPGKKCRVAAGRALPPQGGFQGQKLGRGLPEGFLLCSLKPQCGSSGCRDP